MMQIEDLYDHLIPVYLTLVAIPGGINNSQLNIVRPDYFLQLYLRKYSLWVFNFMFFMSFQEILIRIIVETYKDQHLIYENGKSARRQGYGGLNIMTIIK